MAPPKNAAHYQRLFRARMRDQGLVKKEIWILPENAGRLRDVERDLRLTKTETSGSNPMTPSMTSSMAPSTEQSHDIWTMQSLHQALSKDPLFANGSAILQLVDGTEPCLEITMTEFGDLPIYVTVSGEQIIADAILWPLSLVKDAHSLNDEILRTHKLFPLSTISLDRFPEGEDYYTIFGALSSASLLQNVILEIETLAANAIKATEAYSQHLNGSAA